MKKYAIITAACGHLEEIAEPTVVHKNADYFAFVDSPQDKESVWCFRKAYQFSTDQRYGARRNAKIFKILPELFVPGYEFYFWVDASHDVVADPAQIANLLTDDHPFGLFVHSQRNCIYKEAKILQKLKFDHTALIKEEIKHFKKLGYPANQGLFELSAFVKKQTHATTTASLQWWEYICRYASRDQISLPVVLWQSQIQPAILPGFANGLNEYGTIGNNKLMPQMREHRPSGRA